MRMPAEDDLTRSPLDLDRDRHDVCRSPGGSLRLIGPGTGHLDMGITDRDQFAADWAQRGFSCDLWIDPPGQRWEGFTHATDELVIVLEGEMEFEIAGQVCRPQVGVELLIPAGAVHSARNIGTTTAYWLYGYRR
jgi:mannose-6-phosphate isomerase-like protein (cupin superfamily)